MINWINNLRQRWYGHTRHAPIKKSSQRSSVRLLLEALEARIVPAILYVDNTPSPTAADFSASGGSQANALGVTPYATIQAAVDAASPGDTINVSDGTYPELVSVNKAVTIQGNKFGLDARTRTTANETIVDGAVGGGGRTTAFYITASNATVDGFTSRDQTDVNTFNAGIVMASTTSGVTVRNNIITNNVIGIFAESNGASTISQNLIDGNNQSGPAGGAGIYTETSVNLTIDNNEFRNHTQNNPIIFAATGNNAHTGLNVTNNFIHDNVSGIYALAINGGTFSGNTITTNGTATGLTFGGSDTNISVVNNDLSNNARGLRIANFHDAGFVGANSLITAHYNSFANDSEFGVGNIDGGGADDGYTGTLDVSKNWWGSVTGPTTAANPGGTGSVIRNDFANTIVFQPWLLYGDANSAQVGFQIPTTFTVTAQTSGFTSTNNNYRRLVNAIDPLVSGQTVILSGNFDWTESNAAASWALGNDGVASSGDDYELEVPGNVTGVTVTAASLGSATIQGPGDLPTVNLEGVFVFDLGNNQNWTISKLQIFDFDLSIGMFASSITDFNNTTITNNRIRVPADLNATVAPADVNQNIGINFSFGTNQTISNNQIELVDSGLSDSGSGNFATVVGMQSNTSGGSVYDGLLITGNVLTVTGAQAADPGVVLGIWENGHAHTSNITVSNNQILNNTTGDTPATNLIRGFRVTSHSSATTTVAYTGNTVTGANIGFQWISGSNFTGNQAVRLAQNTLANNDTAILIQSNGLANLFQNTISGAAIGVNVLAGSLTAAGAVLNAVEQNSITATGDAVVIAAGSSVTAPIFNNVLNSTGAGKGVNNLSGTLVNASANYWGTITPAGVAGKVSALVDYTPWLNSGTDTSGTAGFQGDFSVLNVGAAGPQAGGGGRITEAIGLLTPTGTVNVFTGTYGENVNTAGKAVTLAPGGSGVAQVTINNLTLDSNDTFKIDITGTTAGTQYDQLVVNGTVTLGNATLQITTNAFQPATGNTFVIISNDAADPVIGQFFGLSQFSVVTINGKPAVIRYDGAVGGDNDVVLVVTPPVTQINGDLYVFGTSGDDNINVNTADPTNVLVKINNVPQLNPNSPNGKWVITDPQTHALPGGTHHLIVYAGAGNDTVTTPGIVDTEVHGGDGNDVITGGSGDDVLYGDAGSNYISGMAGDDVLVAGTGVNVLDQLFGGDGNDILIDGDMIPGSNSGGNWDYAAFHALIQSWSSSVGGSTGAQAASLDLWSDSSDDIARSSGQKVRMTGGGGKDWFFSKPGDTVLDFSAADKDYNQTN